MLIKYKVIWAITVTSHERHGVSNHRQMECLFNSLFRLITKKTIITVSLWWGPTIMSGSPHKATVIRRTFPCHDAIVIRPNRALWLLMAWCWSCRASISPVTTCAGPILYIMSAMASQNTGISVVCPTVCSGADQSKHLSSASQAFARGIHWWPVVSPHKGPVTRKMFLFDDVIMIKRNYIDSEQ